jgi:hypothetical protein
MSENHPFTIFKISWFVIRVANVQAQNVANKSVTHEVSSMTREKKEPFFDRFS